MKAFFDAIRPAFGGSLSQRQVDGMDALLKEGRALPRHHMAQVLSNVRRETGGGMYPIKETVMPHHKDQNPSDAEVIRRLDRAFAAGKLTWVKTPYWRNGEFGRGQIQLTHEANRLKFGIANRDDLLKPDVSARVAVQGMRDGMFTGKKLADYEFPEALSAPPKSHPRRIVNGVDGSDKEITDWHHRFHAALQAAGWPVDGHGKAAVRIEAAVPRPDMAQVETTEAKPDSPTQNPIAFIILAALAFLAAAFGGLADWIRSLFGG